jgi:pimeloyl-ACP methyl ester carboxylesterase
VCGLQAFGSRICSLLVVDALCQCSAITDMDVQLCTGTKGALCVQTEIVAARLFNSFRTKENVRAVLQKVYVNTDAVDDELVDDICKPGEFTPRALQYSCEKSAFRVLVLLHPRLHDLHPRLHGWTQPVPIERTMVHTAHWWQVESSTLGCMMQVRFAAEHDDALPVFVSIVTGPPGPKPEVLLPEVKQPVLILWGDQDIFTPLDVRALQVPFGCQVLCMSSRMYLFGWQFVHLHACTL